MVVKSVVETVVVVVEAVEVIAGSKSCIGLGMKELLGPHSGQSYGR